MSSSWDALDRYRIAEAQSIVTPALLIYPALVHQNIRATLALLSGDMNRWRPHVKTVKTAAAIQCYLEEGIEQFKCSTTLELLSACKAGGPDVLVAFAVVGANAERVRQIAAAYSNTRVSVLVESRRQAEQWSRGAVTAFIDLNSGMNRTGVESPRTSEMIEMAQILGANFRGLHWYDGHVWAQNADQSRDLAFSGYEKLMEIVVAFQQARVEIGEVITSGTPASPFGSQYPGFRQGGFIHRISPGTVAYCDLSSLNQLPDLGYQPAAVVLATVISHPTEDVLTCDAGHKAVSVDSGVPNCAVLGHPELTPMKPSEEHLPIRVAPGFPRPAIGENLYLVPRHVCPTINNFDHALMAHEGHIVAVEQVNARGHEHPLILFAGCQVNDSGFAPINKSLAGRAEAIS